MTTFVCSDVVKKNIKNEATTCIVDLTISFNDISSRTCNLVVKSPVLRYMYMYICTCAYT